MKKTKLTISTLLLALSSLVLAMEPIETITTPRGHELHLVKTSVKDDILTLYFMIENTSDEEISDRVIDVSAIEYIANGRRYPVLKDADSNYVASPYGPYELFYSSGNDSFKIDPGERVIGWLKFEAPVEDAWPLEISMPEMLPFSVEKP